MSSNLKIFKMRTGGRKWGPPSYEREESHVRILLPKSNLWRMN
jgi:hypothetical protein